MANMFLQPELAAAFAELEQNDKHRGVAALVDALVMQELARKNGQLHIAELGGGAHPDRYDRLFARLQSAPGSLIDWVDSAPEMLHLADVYLDRAGLASRRSVIRYQPQDLFDYLAAAPASSLDMAIMKYTFDLQLDGQRLFPLLSRALKPTAAGVITIGRLHPELLATSTNARYFFHGQPVPDGSTVKLHDGDEVTLKFFRESGKPESGLLPGAEMIRYYHSAETLARWAESAGFAVRIGDARKFLITNDQLPDVGSLDVMIITKTNKIPPNE